jgi:hypothetical protein
MITRRVEMYRRGAITGEHLVLECLHMIDPANPQLVLEALPEDVLVQILEFASRYRPNEMLTNHPILPTTDQVLAAEQWIEHKKMSETIAARGHSTT